MLSGDTDSTFANTHGWMPPYGPRPPKPDRPPWKALTEGREAAMADEELFDAMVSRYPDWVSRQEFLLVGLPSAQRS